jgi:hypothetical protein
MFRPIQKQQSQSPLPIPKSGGQLNSLPVGSSDMTRSPAMESDTNIDIIHMTPQISRGEQTNDLEIATTHNARLDHAEITVPATPFFVRGNRGEPNNRSRIDFEKFNEYLAELEALSIAAGGEKHKDQVQKKLIDKLAKIRAINIDEAKNEAKRASSDSTAEKGAAAGIDNVKAYTYRVTDLLRDAGAAAEHLALKSLGNAEQKQKFHGLAALFIQTKRLVRGVGAEKILVDAAKTVDEKLMELMSDKPDSSLITTKTVATTPPHAFSKYTVGEVNSLVVDEQGLLLYFPAKTVSAAGHGTVGLASMTDGVTAAWGKDNFRAALTFSDLLKTTLNEKANSTWIKSSGQNSRRLLSTLSAVKHGLGFITGQLHTEGFSSSIYSNDKLGKTRVENAFAINDVIQKSLVDAKWKEGVNNLVNRFFLPLTEDIKIRQDGNLPPPANPYEVITELIKGSYSDHGANFTATVGKHWNVGKISPGLSGTGVLSYDRLHFDMELPSKPSDLLDSAFHQDVRETLKLHDTVIQKLDPASKSREKSGIFHQYQQINARFAALHSGTVDRDFTPDEINYFGEKNSIQSVFHRPILSPSPDTAIGIKNCLDDLGKIHGNVVDGLSNLGSPRGMPTALKGELKNSKREIIRQINSQVWGDTYPDGEKGAMKDTEKFKRQTLYNLEAGLGRVGIELALLNRHHEQGNTSLDDDQLIALNEQYAGLKAGLTSRDFLGNPNKDIAYSPLKTIALFNRHQIIASGTLIAGANLSSLIYHGDVTPSNVAGDLYVKLQAQYENATNQFDPTREGQFLVLSFELASGLISALPPAARLQEHAVHAVSKTVMAIVRKSIANEKVEFSEQSWQEISQHLIGTLGTNVQTGAKVAIKLHQPYDNAEWRLQKITESKTQQGGLDVNVPFVEIAIKDSSTKQEQQIVGADWSIHKMTIKYLNAAIKESGSMVLNDQLATRYFSIPNTITQIVDDAMSWTDTYLAGRETQGDAIQDGNNGSKKRPYPSDIHRFLGDPALVRSAERAPEVQRYAPGTPKSNATSPLTRMASLCQQVGATENWAKTKADWDVAKAKIESYKTFNERRDYWKSEDGQRLLKTFIDMVEIYTEVTTAVGKHADETHKPTNSGMTNKVALPKTGRVETLGAYLMGGRAKNNVTARTSVERDEDDERYELAERQIAQQEES